MKDWDIWCFNEGGQTSLRKFVKRDSGIPGHQTAPTVNGKQDHLFIKSKWSNLYSYNPDLSTFKKKFVNIEYILTQLKAGVVSNYYEPKGGEWTRGRKEWGKWRKGINEWRDGQGRESNEWRVYRFLRFFEIGGNVSSLETPKVSWHWSCCDSFRSL